MKSKIFLAALLCVSMMSCAQETPKVKHKTKKETTQNKNAKTKFVNAVDPICKMKTDENTKVSAVYKNKTYGFCSDYCKDEFLKSPEKYAR
jgi:YHS domain-containing protein